MNAKSIIKFLRGKVSEFDDRELDELQLIVNREWEKRFFKSLDVKLKDIFDKDWEIPVRDFEMPNFEDFDMPKIDFKPNKDR